MPITLEEAESKLKAFAEQLIAQVRQGAAKLLKLPAQEIELLPGEWYAGAVLNEDGTVKHHTIVVDSQPSGLNADQAEQFAKDRGCHAPDEQEARLILAHRYSRLAGMSWFWLGKKHENASYAWLCLLYGGSVGIIHRSASGGGVAVRRVKP